VNLSLGEVRDVDDLVELSPKPRRMGSSRCEGDLPYVTGRFLSADILIARPIKSPKDEANS
jgi:hypothetical protein